MRARIYIDGFNLYYRRLKYSRYKWVDLSALSNELLGPDDEIDLIRYFTADVTARAGDKFAPLRQKAYFRALKTIDNFEIHKGKFLSKEIVRPLVGQERHFVDIHDTEEKGSDVNLASHLLMDAIQGSVRYCSRDVTRFRFVGTFADGVQRIEQNCCFVLDG